MGNSPSVSNEKWPEWIEEMTQEKMVTVVCQVNGKIRARMELPADLAKEELEKLVLDQERIKKLIGSKKVAKVVVVPNKLVNIVVKA